MNKGVILAIISIGVMLSSSVVAAEPDLPYQPIRTAVGLTLGTPAIVNVSASRYVSTDWGVRVSGGYFPGRGKRYMSGLQLGIVRTLKQDRNVLYDASLFFGYLSVNTDESTSCFWRYVGVAGSVRWKSLFCELGLTVGSGTYSNPVGMGQVGVILYTGRKKSP